jgi:hypothetical protein
MKFKIAKIDPPKRNDIRIRRIFAWKKTRVGDYEVWLESYQVTEKFFQPAGGNPGWWSETDRTVLEWMY